MTATALAGLASGAVLYLAFRGFMDRAKLREWKRKRRAHVLSLYLFGDDPLISLRGLGQIARANAMLLVYALPALAIAAPLLGGITITLDRWMDRPSLAVGATAVVTAHWTGACEPQLETPAWLRVDSPPVHAPALHEVSWRVRAVGQGGGSARVGCEGKWRNARLISEQPSRAWVMWFGLIAWVTAWLLSVGERLFRLHA